MENKNPLSLVDKGLIYVEKIICFPVAGVVTVHHQAEVAEDLLCFLQAVRETFHA